MARAMALLAAGAALAAGQPVAKGQEDHVSMYKVVAGECAQATIARKFEGAATALAGLRPGACRSQGFHEAEGSKVVSLPVLGQVTVELYKKADLLGLAADLGAQALGLQGTSACCRVCKHPSIRHYSIETAHGRCTEACVPPGGAYWLLRAVMPNLTRAGSESCSTLGFPAYNTTVTHGIAPVSLSRDLYSPPTRGLVALSKFVGGMCGQAIVSEKSEAQVVKAIGLQRGYCVNSGYTEAAGSKKVEVPVVGDIQMALFRRPGQLDLVDALRVSLSLLAEQVTLYKITNDLCGEATIDKTYEAPAESFAGLRQGTCKDQGYTAPAGSKDLHVPVLGEIKIALYKKAESSQVIV